MNVPQAAVAIKETQRQHQQHKPGHRAIVGCEYRPGTYGPLLVYSLKCQECGFSRQIEPELIETDKIEAMWTGGITGGLGNGF